MFILVSNHELRVNFIVPGFSMPNFSIVNPVDQYLVQMVSAKSYGKRTEKKKKNYVKEMVVLNFRNE